MHTETDSSSIDLTYDVLSNRRRRIALRYLSENGETELSELARQVAAQQLDKPVHQLHEEEGKRVYVALYQCHLPKMDDADVIVYDQDERLVRLASKANTVMKFLPERRPSSIRKAFDRIDPFSVGTGSPQ